MVKPYCACLIPYHCRPLVHTLDMCSIGMTVLHGRSRSSECHSRHLNSCCMITMVTHWMILASIQAARLQATLSLPTSRMCMQHLIPSLDSHQRLINLVCMSLIMLSSVRPINMSAMLLILLSMGMPTIGITNLRDLNSTTSGIGRLNQAGSIS